MHHWSFLFLFPASADQPVGDVHRMLPIDITPQVFSLAEEDVQRKIWEEPVGDVHRMLPIDITLQVFSLAEEDVQRKIWEVHDNRCAGMQKITTTLGEARFLEGVPIFLRKN